MAATRFSNGWPWAAWPRCFAPRSRSSHGFEKILVIKRILPHLAADPNFVAMFIDEAKLTAQLTHPKIVQVLDFGEVRGQYFIALEYVDGFDVLGLLRVAAQKRVHVPRTLAVFIVSEVLDALDYAHNARDMEGKPMQIVHRDISPSNIFISKRGDVKLGDFGIAHAQRRESKTQAGTLKGKYGYMSPEQVVGRPIDARSDLFAVGVVLAELLTGRRLFTAPADLDVLLKVRDVKLDRLDKYGADLAQGAGPHRPPGAEEGPARALREPRPSSATRWPTTCSRAGQRVGPTDLRTFTGTLFDTSPDAAARLLQDARRHGDAEGRAPRRRPRRSRARARAASSAGRSGAHRAGGDARARPPSLPQTPTLEADVVVATRRPPRPAGARPARAAGPRTRSSERSSVPGFTPVSRPGETRAGGAAAPVARRPAPTTHSDVGTLRLGARPSARPTARATSASSRRCACSAIWRWRARRACCTSSSAGTVKEIFLVGGAPESVSSSNAERALRRVPGRQAGARAGRPRARAQHAAPLQRQARRHAGGAGAAAAARRVPAAVASRSAIA